MISQLPSSKTGSNSASISSILLASTCQNIILWVVLIIVSLSFGLFPAYAVSVGMPDVVTALFGSGAVTRFSGTLGGVIVGSGIGALVSFGLGPNNPWLL